MNIVVSSNAFLPRFGGTIQYARMLARAFRDAGHDVTVLTRTPGDTHIVDGVPILRCPSWREKTDLAKRTDILLQVESSWQDALPFMLKGVPWFPTLHRGRNHVPLTQLKSWLRMQFERIAFHTGHTIGVSHYALSSWGVEGTCIGSSYEDRLFFSPDSTKERDIDLFFIGRMTYDKGALVLLEAIRKIIAADQLILRKVYFAGTGPALEELRDGCAVLSGLVEIRTLGAVPTSEDVAGYLQRTKILVFPTTSRWLEASPIVPLEGLACGCYVVASDIGGTRENVGPKGFLVRPDDIDHLAETLTRILKDPPPFDETTVQDFLLPRKVQATATCYLQLFEKSLH